MRIIDESTKIVDKIRKVEAKLLDQRSINELRKYCQDAQNAIDNLVIVLQDKADNVNDTQLLKFSNDLNDSTTLDILRQIEGYFKWELRLRELSKELD